MVIVASFRMVRSAVLERRLGRLVQLGRIQTGRQRAVAAREGDRVRDHLGVSSNDWESSARSVTGPDTAGTANRVTTCSISAVVISGSAVPTPPRSVPRRSSTPPRPASPSPPGSARPRSRPLFPRPRCPRYATEASRAGLSHLGRQSGHSAPQPSLVDGGDGVDRRPAGEDPPDVPGIEARPPPGLGHTRLHVDREPGLAADRGWPWLRSPSVAPGRWRADPAPAPACAPPTRCRGRQPRRRPRQRSGQPIARQEESDQVAADAHDERRVRTRRWRRVRPSRSPHRQGGVIRVG